MPDAPRDPPPDPAPGDGPPRDGPHDGARDGPHDGATLIVPGGIDASDSAPPAAIDRGEGGGADGGGPLVFGRYRLIRPLGRGGMGAVYLARDVQLDRDVALKTPSKRAAANPELAERFLREARAAALLRHPHLCPVFDAGEEDGRLYLTMAYLPGRSLREATGGPQPIRATARLLGRLADAMAHAHDQGVVHRDLKPGNVMLDERGKPAITDFGLALRTGGGATDGRVTQSGAALGTPAYMAPEQIVGRQDLIGPRSDIYSLGVILYELLTGRLPFGGDAMAMMGQALTQTARPPGEVRAEAGDGFAPVPAALESIWRRMTALDPAERFDSMHEVRDALADFVKTGRGRPDDEPEPDPDSDSGTDAAAESGELRIAEPAPDFSALRELDSTHPGPIVLPVRRLGRRSAKQKQAARWKRGLAAVAALAALGAVALLFGDPADSLQTLTGDVPGDVAAVSAGDGATDPPPVDPPDLPGGAPASVVEDETAPARWAVKLENGAHLRTPLRFDGEGPITFEIFVTPLKAGRYGDTLVGNFDFGGCGLWMEKGRFQMIWHDRDDYRRSFSATPAVLGRRVHVAGVWDGESVQVFVDGVPGPAVRIGETVPSKWPVFIGADPNKSGDAEHEINATVEAVRITRAALYDGPFDPPDRFLPQANTALLYRLDEGAGRTAGDASGSGHDGELWGGTWERIDPPAPDASSAEAGRSAEAGPAADGWIDLFDGRTLDGWERNHAGRETWSVEDGLLVGALPAGGPWSTLTRALPPGDCELRLVVRRSPALRGSVGFLAGGEHVLGAAVDLGSDDRGSWLGKMNVPRQSGGWGHVDVSESTRRRIAAAAAMNGEPPGWDVLTIRSVGPRLRVAVNGVAASTSPLPDPKPDDRVRIVLDRNDDAPARLEIRSIRVRPLDPDGEPVAPAVPMRLVAEVPPPRVLTGHEAGVRGVAVTPDGRSAVSASFDRSVRVWDLDTGAQRAMLAGHDDAVVDVAVTSDGRRAVTASVDATLRVWDLDDGREEHTLRGYDYSVYALALAPDGRRAVSLSNGGSLRVWDLDTGAEQRRVAAGVNGGNTRLAVTPDGRYAVGSAWDGTLRVWDLGAGRLEFALATDAGHLYDVAVTPDGAHAVTGSSDGTVRLWDLRDGQPGRVLRGHTGSVWGVAVAPDGRHVVSGSLDRTVRVWDVASGRCERTLTGHADTVKRLCVTPDGLRLVSASMDRTLRVWDLFEPDPDPPESNPGAPDPGAPDPDAPDPRAAAAGPGPAADGRVDLFNARDLTDRAPRRVPRRRVACGGRGGKVAG